jgi:glycosyltransferase involved in cell wall biosynthesis
VRICHVSPHLPPDQAANALLPAQLGTWAAAAGDGVCFVAEAPAQGGSSARLPGPVRRVPRRVAGTALTRALRIDTWKRTRAIRAALDDVAADADLVHLHSNGLIVEMASRWATRRGLPTVLTMYGTEIWHYRRRRPIDLFTQAYMRAAAVTFYSRRLLDTARALGLSRPNLTVIYPAVGDAFVTPDRDMRAAWRRELEIGEPLVILNVKRLHELAGQRFLIEAFARVARGRDDVRLVICGTGPLRQALEERAAALGVSRRVTFAGLVPNDRIARYAAVADVFALPSLLEALPTVAVEALAAGTPVVTADHPGGLELAEIFGDDVIVVRRENVEELADQLTASIERPRRVRQETPALVERHFSARAIQAAYFDLYASTARAWHG